MKSRVFNIPLANSKGTTKKSNSPRHSLHDIGITGCRFISQEDNAVWKRLLWVALLVACTCTAVVQMGSQIRRMYASSNIATNFDLLIKDELEFPAVTLCSTTKVRLQALYELLTEFGIQINVGNEVIDGNMEERLKNGNLNFPSDPVLRRIASQADSLILECYWWDEPCRKEDITVATTNTGICYTINGRHNASKRVSSVGMEGSLSLILNVETYETLQQKRCDEQRNIMAHQSGIMVKVHNRNEIPLFDDALLLPAGFTHELKVLEITVRFCSNRITALFEKKLIDVSEGGTCSDGQQLKHYKPTDGAQHYLSSCQMDSLLTAIEKVCACRPFNAPPVSSKSDATLKDCTVTQHFNCVDGFLFGSSAKRSKYKSDCRVGCHSLQYSVIQRFSNLPDQLLDPAIGRIFQFENETVDSNTEKCATYLISRKKAIRMRQDFLQAVELKWKSNFMDAKIERSSKAYMDLASSFVNLMLQGFAPYKGYYVTTYARLQNRSQCFNKITTNYLPYIGFVKNALQFYPNGLALANSPDMQLASESGNADFDLLATANQLIKDRLQFMQLIQIYSNDNYYRWDERSRILEEYITLLKLVTQPGVKSYTAYEKLMGNPHAKILAAHLDARLKKIIQSDFELKILGVLDIMGTKYAISYIKSLNTGDKIGNETLRALFSSENSTIDELDSIRQFVSLLVECSTNELPTTVGEILYDFYTAYDSFLAAHETYMKELDILSDDFVWGEQFIRKNLLVVNVNFGDLQVQNIAQTKTYTGWSLLCDVGGTLGLFLGASILTLFEALYLIYHHCTRTK